MNFTKAQSEALAERLLIKCCIEGMRSDTGVYRRIDDEDKLIKKLATFIREFNLEIGE